MNNKKGSSAVFITVIFAALVSITLVLIYSAREESVKSRVDGVLNLAGDSIMSEFDYNVQKEYGLFILSMDNNELERKIESYVNYSLGNVKDIEIQEISASGSRFSIVNKFLIKKQMLEHMKTAEAEGVLKNITNRDEQEENLMMQRNLRHGPTIVSLPSGIVEKRNLTALAEQIAESEKDISKVFEEGTEKYLLTSYLFLHFNSRTNAVNEEHFFRSEIEYVLGGELSDKRNEKRVELALKAMRFVLNLAHIYSDDEKNAATLTMAQLMTPGAAAATQAALASTWAYAEADNDVELLWQGGKVPFKKSKDTWAIDLDGAVEGITQGVAKPSAEKGYTYTDYLKILAYFQDDEMMIARMLDLIQINMRKNYNSEFLIQDHAAGIVVKATVNGRDYGYEKKY
jgi:hypothetical protein